MIELALIRSLMQKDFYEEHKGSKCPDRLFSKDVRKIKGTLDEAMKKHERNLSLTELQALFFSDNGTMTSANKASFEVLFSKLSKEEKAASLKVLYLPGLYNGCVLDMYLPSTNILNLLVLGACI